MSLRYKVEKILVDECPFVDNCKRQCTPTAQETCWDKHLDQILTAVEEEIEGVDLHELCDAEIARQLILKAIRGG